MCSLEGKSEEDELQLKTILEKLQEGYSKRDVSKVKSWIQELFDEEVTVIGTNAINAGDFEWRKGHDAAIEMFQSDWQNWGDVVMNLTNAQIDIEDQNAWIAMNATVTRNTKDSERHSAELSRQRSLKRIKEYSEKKWKSKRALYEIIHDASMILTQYERGETFVWPIRISLGLIKRQNNWKIRNVHFSFPGRGFPNVRIEE